MKVILLRDVAKLGKRFSVVQVPDGFALNKLIPQGFAESASAENLKRIKVNNDKQASEQTNALTNFTDTLDRLKEVVITVPVEANAQDHLFKSVKAVDLASALALAAYPLPVSTIKLAEPIKSLGAYPVTVSLGEITGVVNFELVSK